MRSNRNKIAASVVVVILVVSFFGIKYYKAHTEQKTSQSSEHLVTKQDRAPLPLPSGAQSIKMPILMYHHVGTAPLNSNATRRDLTVTTENFESQVAWLSEQKYTSISLEQFYLYTQGKFVLPKKPVIFTFDDGYEDVFLNAVPILKKYGYTGSFGIITQWPGQTMDDNIYAGWQEITLAKNEGMEIVSHTQNHFDGANPKFNSDYIFKNLSGSIADIQNHLGFTTNILIYPYGHYNSDYITQAQKLGFVLGITVHEGDTVNLDSLMEIPRIRVHGQETLERFEKNISE